MWYRKARILWHKRVLAWKWVRASVAVVSVFVAVAAGALLSWGLIDVRQTADVYRSMWVDIPLTYPLGPVDQLCARRHSSMAVEVRCTVVDGMAVFCRLKCRR